MRISPAYLPLQSRACQPSACPPPGWMTLLREMKVSPISSVLRSSLKTETLMRW